MSFVQADENNDKIPVALGLKEKNLYLSCVMKDSKPTLQLEVSEHQGWRPFAAPLGLLWAPSVASKTATFSYHRKPGSRSTWQFCINVNKHNY